MKAKALFLVLLFLSAGFAQSVDPELQDAEQDAMEQVSELLQEIGVTKDTCAPDEGPLDLAGPSAIALLVIGVGLAIFYMAASFFNSPQMLAMAKQEGFEFIHTLIIVVLFLSFLSFAQGLLGVHGVGPIDVYSKAMEYCVVMVQKITGDMFWLGFFNNIVYLVYSSPLRIGILHQAVHFNLGGILKPMVDGLGTMASLLSFAMGEWIVQLILLCLIKKHMLTVFLPIGILLKTFPQTRGGGNAIIAIAIALSIIYPMMVLMNYQAYQYRYGQMDAVSGIGEILSDWTISGGTLATAAVSLFLLKGLLKTLPGIILLSWLVTVFFDLYADVIYTVFVLSIFLPLLNIFVTFTFARELAKYFGTEINIAAFTKLI